MEITTILWTTFISLVGLQLCVPDGDTEKMADHYPSFWCGNPLLRIIYGLFQLLGAVFVIGFALYLTFGEHWWYIIVYFGGAIIAKLVAFLLQIPIALIFSKQIQVHMYGGLIYKRVIGTVLIILGLILLLATL